MSTGVGWALPCEHACPNERWPYVATSIRGNCLSAIMSELGSGSFRAQTRRRLARLYIVQAQQRRPRCMHAILVSSAPTHAIAVGRQTIELCCGERKPLYNDTTDLPMVARWSTVRAGARIMCLLRQLLEFLAPSSQHPIWREENKNMPPYLPVN